MSRDLRRQILAAATKHFIEQGYRGLSMRQISEAVGVSKAALYYHFRDKEALFLAVLYQYLEEVGALVLELRELPGGSRVRIRLLIERILAQPVEQRALLRLVSQDLSQLSPAAQQEVNQAYREKFIGRIAALLREGMQLGELRTVDPDAATWLLLGMIYPYFSPSPVGRLDDAGKIGEQIASIYLDGLAQRS